ncbi:hypothetical protein [Rhodopseudomonas parapalustris]
MPVLQKETRAALEERAEVELNTSNIRMAIMNAAREGQTALRVKMPSNLDVRGTKASATLTEWCKGEGLALSWESREADLPDGRRATVWEPEISWAAKS